MSTSARWSGRVGIVLLAWTLAVVAGGPAGAAPAGPPAQAEPGASPVIAIPAPGSSTSSPATTITLSGADPSAIGPVTVTGSESGEIAGRTESLVRGAGAVFTPDAELAPGETVEVTSSVVVVGADAPTYSFTVGSPAPDAGFDLDGELDVPEGRSGTPRAAAPEFVTRPDLRPPGIDINQAASGTAPGWMFATPGATAQGTDPGVLIYDDSGQPVWFKPDTSATDVVGDAHVTTFQGAPALVWFEGFPPFGAGSYRGEWVVVDGSYREVARIRMGNGYRADIHDILLTDQGTAYLLAYNPVTCTGIAPLADCTPGATVLDGVVQEVDIASGQVLWEWHSLDHVALADSYFDRTAPVFDYFHVNSIDLDDDGEVLLTARNSSAMYKVDRTTGELIWTFGGRHTSFPTVVGNPSGTTGPDYAHDVEARGGGSYSYFDNGVARFGPSRGEIVTLDPASGTATFTTNLVRPTPVFAGSQGNLQPLTGGGNLVSWGNLGIATEYDAAGNVIFDASFTGTSSYRQFRQEWTGSPSTRPTAHAAAATGGTSVAVSWNGDTRTATWRILAGDSVDSLAPVATVDRAGFETSTVIAGRPARVVVEALDAGGGVLGRSAPVGGGQWFAEEAGPSVSGSYRPLVGDFGGGRNDDIIYYRPGTGGDFLHVSDGAGGFASTLLPSVNGDYTPLVGDFVGDDRDEVLWTRAGNPYASVWRFDGRPRSGPVSVSSGVFVVPATVTKSLVLDHRPAYGGGNDEILFYAAGAAADRVVHLSWPGGRGLSQSVRPISVGGTYAPVTGDFDGNGQADILWYAAGTRPDYLWLTTGSATRSTGQRSVPETVNGSYQVFGENHYGTDRRDEVVFFGSGAAPDTMWVFDDFGSHLPVDASTNAAGFAIPLQGGHSSLMTWFPGSSPGILVTDPLPPAFRPSGNGSLTSGYYPIVGGFVGAPGTSSVLWYAAGAAPERLYVGG